MSEWPRTKPDAKTLFRYYVDRAQKALEAEQEAADRGLADDATEDERKTWVQAIDRMLVEFSVAFLLRDATDEQAEGLWVCIDSGDLVPEFLWDWTHETEGADGG